MDIPDLALPYSSAPCAHGVEVSCKGGSGVTAGFPEPKINGGARLDLEGQPPFGEDESGSKRCPPRGKLCCLITDRLRPSEQRGSKRDGGLLSSTMNPERSRGVDRGFGACRGMVRPGVTPGFTSGMQAARFTCIGSFTVSQETSLGRSHGVDGEHFAGRGAVGPGVSLELGNGFACKGVSGVGGFACKEFSCMLDSESGEGTVRSSVDAAQSQWEEREP